MKTSIFGSAILAASLALFGADAIPLRLDVTGQPEGARVSVDGKLRGTLRSSAPCAVLPLAPGRHLLHVEAPYYHPLDTYIYLDEATNYVSHAVDLEPERGIVLLTTKPAGAAVTYNGSDIGTTPLLVTSLACGRRHALEFACNGYQRKRIEVSVESRRPIVRNEELVLDSGIVACTTEPPGATVLVNGIERGATPLDVMIPRGGARLTVRLDGYKEVEQSVGVVPGERRTLALKLEGLPARLSVVTEPEQAKVYLDGDYQGKSPVVIESARPGMHEIRVERTGYAPDARSVQLENGGDATETFVLRSVLGRLEIITSPPGAHITVDGRAAGSTRAQGEAEKSQILMIENVAAGEHAVGAHLDGYLDVSRKVVVGATETRQIYIPMKRHFVADIEVETINGAPVRGALVPDQTTPRDIVVETRPGVFRTIRRDTIRKITPISK